MGIEPFLAASSIVGILAQRLVRRICPHCREELSPLPASSWPSAGLPDDGAALLPRGAAASTAWTSAIAAAPASTNCCRLTNEIRDLLLQKGCGDDQGGGRQRKGMKSLRDAGLAKALAGETTLEEILRVTQEEV